MTVMMFFANPDSLNHAMTLSALVKGLQGQIHLEACFKPTRRLINRGSAASCGAPTVSPTMQVLTSLSLELRAYTIRRGVALAAPVRKVH